MPDSRENPSAAPAEQRGDLTPNVQAFLKRERSRPIRQALLERLRAKHAPGLKLQLPSARSDLNVDGRPDGQRPHDQESLLEYHLDGLESYKATDG